MDQVGSYSRRYAGTIFKLFRWQIPGPVKFTPFIQRLSFTWADGGNFYDTGKYADIMRLTLIADRQ